MSKFIKVTIDSTGNPILINVNLISSVVIDVNNGKTLIHEHGDDIAWRVSESFEEVCKMISEYTCFNDFEEKYRHHVLEMSQLFQKRRVGGSNL